MTILSPSNLETISYRQQGWNAILTDNLQLLNTYLAKLWGPTQATVALGVTAILANATTVTDPAALTQDDLTDSSGGTPSTTIAAVAGSGADTEINNNFASLTAELALVKADNGELKTQLEATIDYCDDLKGKVNALLTALRTTGGCGVLAD